MNEMLMNKLTDAQNYKHIAKELETWAKRSYYARHGIAEIDPDLCLRFTKEALGRKADLIALLSKHPNWDAKEMRIKLNACEMRVTDPDIAAGRLQLMAKYLIDSDCNPFLFETMGAAKVAGLVKLGHVLNDWTVYSTLSKAVQIDAEMADYIKHQLPDAHVHAGTKTTKAIIRLLRQYGLPATKYPAPDPEDGEAVKRYDFLENRWRAPIALAYTQYADIMNPVKMDRQFIFSVNPADFLRMSANRYFEPRAWTSCHSIITPGGWSAGCSSYAFDRQTVIMYTLMPDVPEDEVSYSKLVTRQLIFWNGTTLFPCRIYPQDTDGCSDVYGQYRQIAEQVWATCLGIPNLWTKVSDKGERDCEFRTEGHQYPDYQGGYNFKLYKPSEYAEASMLFKIGSDDAFCLSCGKPLDCEGVPVVCNDCAYQNHARCVRCGDPVDPDDATMFNGDYYCDYCRDEVLCYCDHCENWEYQDDCQDVVTYNHWEGRHTEVWCRHCTDWDAFYCDGSEAYYASDYFDRVDTEDGYTLERGWADENANYCEECGRYWYCDDEAQYREDAEMNLCDECYAKWLEENEVKANDEEVAC